MHRTRNAWILLLTALFWLSPQLWAAPSASQSPESTVDRIELKNVALDLAGWLSARWNALWQASTAGAENDEAQADEPADDGKDDEPGPGGPSQELGPWIVPIG